MPAFDDAPEVQPESRDEWRAWLEANHETASGAWLVLYRATGDRTPPVTYDAAVEEALCFGWVDGKAGKVDEARTRLYISPRRPRSGWAATNKARVERLIAEGRMAPAGLRAIEVAKENGSWTVFDAATREEVPDDLAAALAARPPARATWDAYPGSLRRQLLGEIALARKPETRARRIDRIADAAERGERPGQAQPRH